MKGDNTTLDVLIFLSKCLVDTGLTRDVAVLMHYMVSTCPQVGNKKESNLKNN
jgi:hypothetical protein